MTSVTAINHARPAQFDRTRQHRRAMIGKINVARHQLAMAEDDYRQNLLEVTGETSLRRCDDRQLVAMIDRLKRLGFQPKPKKASAAAQHPMARKARALWISLYHLNVVRNPAEGAIEAFAKRQLGCEKLAWAQQSFAYRLIEALKDMAERNGWLQADPQTGKRYEPMQLQEGLCQAILKRLKEADAVPADWTLDTAAMRLCGIDTGQSDHGYSAEHYARLAKALGDTLRHFPKA